LKTATPKEAVVNKLIKVRNPNHIAKGNPNIILVF